MCGQLGVVFGTKKRTKKDIDHLTGIFTELLLLSEERGFHATGVGWVNSDGEHRVYKQPVPAQEFVQDPAFEIMLDQVDDRVTILMGHTRWKTRGSQYDNANNHPQIGQFCQGTHNGHIGNADYLFSHLKLPRKAEVDSEVIFRIADSVVVHGRIDVHRLGGRLALCRGQMSAVITTWLDPKTMIIVKGDKPMEFLYHRKHRAMIYASESRFLEAAVAGETGWTSLRVPPMSLLVFHCEHLMSFREEPFHYAPIARIPFPRS